MGSTPEPDLVFVSYSRVDAEFALKLARDLRAAGVRLWVDQLDLSPGERWDQATERALNICQTVVVVLSPDAVASANVMDEVSFAIDERKHTVPVICRQCKVPLRLRRLEFVDFTTPSYETSLARLSRSLVRGTGLETLEQTFSAAETSLFPPEAVEADKEAVSARSAPDADLLKHSKVIEPNDETDLRITRSLSNDTSPHLPELLRHEAEQPGPPATARIPDEPVTKAGMWARTRPLWNHQSVGRGPLAVVVGTVAFLSIVGYYYAGYVRLVDAYLHEKHDRALPRLFAGPIELRTGQSMTEGQLVDRLNDVAYAVRSAAARPGEFDVRGGSIAFIPREAEFTGQTIRATFQRQPASGATAGNPRQTSAPAAQYLQLAVGSRLLDHLTLDAPTIASVVLSEIPERVVQAVLAIEEPRFWNHTVLFSGITSRLARDLLVPRLTVVSPGATDGTGHSWRQGWISLALAQRASRGEMLERYLNDVPLGQRGSYIVMGVSEASRLFFRKDIRNITLAEAATIAGIIQSPLTLSPFTNAAACRERRNEVLEAMVDSGYISQDVFDRASRETLAINGRVLPEPQGAVPIDSRR